MTTHWEHDTDLSYLASDHLFRDIWWRTESIPGSFTRLNAAKLYEYAMAVPRNAVIVEVGVDQGRSASILLRTAQLTNASLVFVDSWESVLIDNKAKFNALVRQFEGVSTVVCHGRSEAVATGLPGPFDLIHIDADHYDGIAQDCKAWLPKLKSGGVVCFHDYGATFPQVTEAVDKYTDGWAHLGNWDSLAIRRKP